MVIKKLLNIGEENNNNITATTIIINTHKNDVTINNYSIHSLHIWEFRFLYITLPFPYSQHERH